MICYYRHIALFYCCAPQRAKQGTTLLYCCSLWDVCVYVYVYIYISVLSLSLSWWWFGFLLHMYHNAHNVLLPFPFPIHDGIMVLISHNTAAQCTQTIQPSKKGGSRSHPQHMLCRQQTGVMILYTVVMTMATLYIYIYISVCTHNNITTTQPPGCCFHHILFLWMLGERLVHESGHGLGPPSAQHSIYICVCVCVRRRKDATTHTHTATTERHTHT